MTLEELLNKLIDKGWKPMGHKPLTDEIKKKVKVERYNRKPMAIVIKNGRKYADDYYSLREIVSIDSGLWQFVCKNGMIDNRLYLNERNKYYEFEMSDVVYTGKDYEYRLIESALCDEDKLEEFLLDNIKIDVENRG